MSQCYWFRIVFCFKLAGAYVPEDIILISRWHAKKNSSSLKTSLRYLLRYLEAVLTNYDAGYTFKFPEPNFSPIALSLELSGRCLQPIVKIDKDYL